MQKYIMMLEHLIFTSQYVTCISRNIKVKYIYEIMIHNKNIYYIY